MSERERVIDPQIWQQLSKSIRSNYAELKSLNRVDEAESTPLNPDTRRPDARIPGWRPSSIPTRYAGRRNPAIVDPREDLEFFESSISRENPANNARAK